MKEMRKVLTLVLCFVALGGMLLAGALVSEPETEPASLVTEAPTEVPSEPKVIAVTGIIVDQTELNVDVGELPIQLVATVLPEDAADKTIIWNSSESDVASVDEKGVLTFGCMGKTVITATAGGFSTQCVVTVSEGESTDSAASIPVVVVSGSDYQAHGSDNTVRNIATQIKKDYASPFGILMGGDYDAGKMYHNASSLEAVNNVITEAFPSIAEENRIMIQGNHEIYGNLSPDSNELLDDTGAYENDYYSVYAINYVDFASASSDLQTYLDGKDGYTKPIFVVNHHPLHETSRGDNAKGVSIFNVLNKFGEKLNIIFLFGHNHSSGYDNYLGGSAIYLKKGDSIHVAGGATSTLNFTYMNYGYLGYCNSGADKGLTMAVFEIYGDKVIIKRYDTNGLHNLKSKGTPVDSYTADTNVYGTAVIDLSSGESTITPLIDDSGDE